MLRRRLPAAGAVSIVMWRGEHLFAYAATVAQVPIPELVENRRRSIAMLPPGAPALNRDEALELLEQLRDALRELRSLRAQLDTR